VISGLKCFLLHVVNKGKVFGQDEEKTLQNIHAVFVVQENERNGLGMAQGCLMNIWNGVL
jgi:hypothetical protein